MSKKKKVFLLMVMTLLITGLIVGCTVAPTIQPQATITEEPSLPEEWFLAEAIPPEVGYQVRGIKIDGETWTCFSPKDSRALAIELIDLRKKLTKMNNRMALLYKRYYHKDHPTWKIQDVIE